ncbi:MAG: hypothetical protein J0H63_00755, partial [Rhizobiales bacterium]|nr:hypothetical protein [Hyphomicrobiales bacterium]
MPRSIYERGLLKPEEVARLQRVFDEACRRRGVVPEGEEAREIALRLLALHNAGLTDESTLIDAAA